MKQMTSREQIAFFVYQVMEEQKHCDTVLHQILRTIEDGSMNRSRIKHEGYGIVERCIELDEIINAFSKIKVSKMKPWVRTALRIGTFEIRYMEQVPDAVACNEAVELVSSHGLSALKGFVNGVLRTISRNQENIVIKDIYKHYSMPEWIGKLLEDAYGRKTTKKILASFLEPKSISLRLNPSKVTKEKFLEACKESDILIEAGWYLDHAFRIQGNIRVEQIPGYDDGWFQIQDESSMLPVYVSGMKKGDTVLDLCAAPGGKTMQAAEIVGSEGMVSSRDVSTYKCDKIKENADRIGYGQVEIKVHDATIEDPDWIGKADVVIADVPCSGIGIIGRKPDIKYSISKDSVASLIHIQKEIVRKAVKYVKPGGVLMYSTCTLNPSENIEMARWIAQLDGMVPASLDEYLPDELKNSMTSEGMLQILPGIHHTDGFFVAKLTRIPQQVH